MFISRHYAGEDLDLKFKTGEYWKKVLGPVYIYLNSNASPQTDPSLLWNDAKLKVFINTVKQSLIPVFIRCFKIRIGMSYKYICPYLTSLIN